MLYRIVGGAPFWQRREIKDVTAYLTIITNPAHQIAYRRATATPPQKIGAVTMGRILEYAAATGCNIAQALNIIAQNHERRRPQPFHLRNDIATALRDFRRRQDELNTLADTVPLSGIIDHVLKEYGLEKHIRNYQEPPTATERWDNVLELRHIAAQRDRQPARDAIAEILSEASLVAAADQRDGAVGITLISLHQTKGLEWPVVFIAGMMEGLMPHSRNADTEEERRLCYVGMTRAQEQLHLSYSDVNVQGRGVERSRFLDEINND